MVGADKVFVFREGYYKIVRSGRVLLVNYLGLLSGTKSSMTCENSKLLANLQTGF